MQSSGQRSGNSRFPPPPERLVDASGAIPCQTLAGVRAGEGAVKTTAGPGPVFSSCTMRRPSMSFPNAQCAPLSRYRWRSSGESLAERTQMAAGQPAKGFSRTQAGGRVASQSVSQAILAEFKRYRTAPKYLVERRAKCTHRPKKVWADN